VAVIVYDITNRSSFKSLQRWIDDVKNQRGEGVIIAILGNKIDSENREVSQE
jgi:Ras-related protein Rab-6A